MASIWTKTCRIEKREALNKDLDTEIAVIGAGMAGVLIAHMLKDSGHEVKVLEARRIAGGQTCNTTAKITCQHGMVFGKLIERLGRENAALYAFANQRALVKYRELVERYGIDCDFEEASSYVYGKDEDALRNEASAAASLGLPASFEKPFDLPFPSAGAVKIGDQAQFHPLKFISFIAGDLEIYEDTPVYDVRDHVLITKDASVRAQKIVFACHFPFIDAPGFYFARMHQERSYVLALKRAEGPNGMWIGADGEIFSLRRYREYLLFGGGKHRCGENEEGGKYDYLRKKAEEYFPGCTEAAFWSAQDCITPDGIPYVGRFAPSKPDWYVATGFGKWGMTASMAAATLLCDLIEKRASACEKIFDPGRFDAALLRGVALEGAEAAKGLAKRFFERPETADEDLLPGHGGIVWASGVKRGVSKDAEGRACPVDHRCPHMGCQLSWNPDEQSWDCPCHGSRFDRTGNLLNGPAKKGLTGVSDVKREE